jgi:hypothetical protein
MRRERKGGERWKREGSEGGRDKEREREREREREGGDREGVGVRV